MPISLATPNFDIHGQGSFEGLGHLLPFKCFVPTGRASGSALSSIVPQFHQIQKEMGQLRLSEN
jgi:hypothetical protein